jgi:hypothetical protein
MEELNEKLFNAIKKRYDGIEVYSASAGEDREPLLSHLKFYAFDENTLFLKVFQTNIEEGENRQCPYLYLLLIDIAEKFNIKRIEAIFIYEERIVLELEYEFGEHLKGGFSVNDI